MEGAFAGYVLEKAFLADFTAAMEIYRGKDPRFSETGQIVSPSWAPFYRVKALADSDGLDREWSNTIHIP